MQRAERLMAARARGWIDNVMDVHPTRYSSVVE
jgi:hypothetical protein